MDAMRAAEVLARLIEIQKAAADRLQNERLAPDRLAMIAPRHSALSFALDGERV
jgi:hypothetical protein